MMAILNSLNAHNLPIFQPILMILVSKFMVHRALSDKTYIPLGLLSPFKAMTVELMLRYYFTWLAQMGNLHCLSLQCLPYVFVEI